MVNARLHVICGNCGILNDFSFKVDMTGNDISDEELKFEPAIFLSCNNCHTLHDLSEYGEFKGIYTSQTGDEDE